MKGLDELTRILCALRASRCSTTKRGRSWRTSLTTGTGRDRDRTWQAAMDSVRTREDVAAWAAVSHWRIEQAAELDELIKRRAA